MPLFNNFFKKKDGPGKVKILGQYYEDNPEAMAFSAKGLNRYGAQDYSGAVIEFTKAINAQPGNQNFYLMRGTASEDAGDDMQAEKDFKKMLELAPTSFIGAYRLGMVYFRKKDFESAIRWLKVSYNNASDLDLSHAGIGNNNIFFIHKKIIAGNLGNFLIHIKKF
jgi:tetratricopeptide (TPR) repeat protein